MLRSVTLGNLECILLSLKVKQKISSVLSTVPVVKFERSAGYCLQKEVQYKLHMNSEHVYACKVTVANFQGNYQARN